MRHQKENPSRLDTGRGLNKCAGTAQENNTTLTEALAAHGLTLPPNAEPGRLVRMPGAGKPQSNRAGWLKIFPDNQGAVFGDWSTDLKETWQARKPANDDELQRWRQIAEQAQAEADHKRHQSATEAAQAAQHEWDTATAPDALHGYLVSKGIEPHSIKQSGDLLLVPVYVDDELSSLQRIGSDGSKRFMPGGMIKGGYHLIGDSTERIIIAEGYATATSIHQATGEAVAVAFNAGNLKAVAEAMRGNYPEAAITIAADDDRNTAGNPGITKATAAARAVSGLVATPGRAGDFNDLHQTEGLEAVAAAIEAAKPPAVDPKAEILRLAALDPLEYDQQRKEVAKAVGVRTLTLDGKVKKHQKAERAESDSAVMDFEDVEPWPDPVDGAELLDEIEVEVNRHCITADHVPPAVALWVLFTWVIDAARTAAILAITSPEKRCGKTTLLALLTRLVRKPLPASNISPAAVFRAIEKWTPTLLIDEADTFLKQNDELRGVLNSGHTRSSAFVIRTVGDDHEPRRFSTWGAKVIAMIGKLPDTLADRALPVAMRRKLPSEKVQRLRADPFAELRQRMARFAEDNADAIRKVEPEIPAGINDRAGDNWEPLLAIADTARGDWPEKARAAALALSGSVSEPESIKTMLLADMRLLLIDDKALSSTDLIAKLAEMEDRPWPEFGKSGKPITAAKVAHILADFHIKPEKLRSESGYNRGTRGYTLESARDAFNRYLPPLQSGEVPQANNDGACGDFKGATQPESVALQKPPKASNGGGCGTSPLSPPRTEEFEL